MSESAADPQVAEAEGQRLFGQGKYRDAADQFCLAQHAYAATGDDLRSAEMLNNAGVAYRRARKHKEAITALEEARRIFAHLGDQPREAQALGNLGGLYSKTKRYDQAETCFLHAISIFQDLDDRGRQSETLRAMAIMQFKRRQYSQAMATYEDAMVFLPNPTPLQQILRFLLRVRGLITRIFSVFK